MKLKGLLIALICSIMFIGYADAFYVISPNIPASDYIYYYEDTSVGVKKPYVAINKREDGLPYLEFVGFSKRDYYYAIVNDNNGVPKLESDDVKGCTAEITNKDVNSWNKYNSDAKQNVLTDWNNLKGYTNVIQLSMGIGGDSKKGVCELYATSFDIEKVAMPELGNRVTVLYSGTNNLGNKKGLFARSFNPNTTGVGAVDPDLYVSVGIINDEDLINKLKNNDESGLAELLAYSKENKSLKEYDVPLNETYAKSFEEIEINEGTFYYLHSYYKDPAYREDTEDISWGVGYRNVIADYNEVKDKIGKEDIEEKEKVEQENVSNPKTGVYDYIIPASILVVLLVFVCFLFKRKELFKKL